MTVSAALHHSPQEPPDEQDQNYDCRGGLPGLQGRPLERQGRDDILSAHACHESSQQRATPALA
jgi:hypothetical protein